VSDGHGAALTEGGAASADETGDADLLAADPTGEFVVDFDPPVVQATAAIPTARRTSARRHASMAEILSGPLHPGR
jgi:hypothetical protein